MGQTLQLIGTHGSSRIRLTDRPLGRGADAVIYRIEGHPELAAKLYHDPTQDPSRRSKLEAMLANPPALPPFQHEGRAYIQIAWPNALLTDSKGSLRGYAMPLVDLSRAAQLEALLNRKTRQAYKFAEHAGYRLSAAANLARLVAELHARQHHIIDLKPANLNVYRETYFVSLLDCDGLSVQGNRQRYPAHQYTPDYIAPEAIRNNLKPEELGEQQDRFALAVILFQLLNQGIHPFQGTPRDQQTLPSTNHERIAEGLFAYGSKAHSRIAPSPWSIHETLPDQTLRYFNLAFGEAHGNRPSAREWADHLAELADPKSALARPCSKNPEHLTYGKGCGLCRLDELAEKSRAAQRRRAAQARRYSAVSPAVPLRYPGVMGHPAAPAPGAHTTAAGNIPALPPLAPAPLITSPIIKAVPGQLKRWYSGWKLRTKMLWWAFSAYLLLSILIAPLINSMIRNISWQPLTKLALERGLSPCTSYTSDLLYTAIDSKDPTDLQLVLPYVRNSTCLFARANKLAKDGHPAFWQILERTAEIPESYWITLEAYQKASDRGVQLDNTRQALEQWLVTTAPTPQDYSDLSEKIHALAVKKAQLAGQEKPWTNQEEGSVELFINAALQLPLWNLAIHNQSMTSLETLLPDSSPLPLFAAEELVTTVARQYPKRLKTLLSHPAIGYSGRIATNSRDLALFNAALSASNLRQLPADFSQVKLNCEQLAHSLGYLVEPKRWPDKPNEAPIGHNRPGDWNPIRLKPGAKPFLLAQDSLSCALYSRVRQSWPHQGISHGSHAEDMARLVERLDSFRNGTRASLIWELAQQAPSWQMDKSGQRALEALLKNLLRDNRLNDSQDAAGNTLTHQLVSWASPDFISGLRYLGVPFNIPNSAGALPYHLYQQRLEKQDSISRPEQVALEHLGDLSHLELVDQYFFEGDGL